MQWVGAGSLSAQLAVYAADATGAAPSSSPELEARLGTLLADGRAAWPALPLSDEELLRYLADRIPEGASLPGALDSLRAADLHLACACALGKPRALETFERHCLSDLAAVLSRFSTSPEFHDEVRQAVRERLFVFRPGAHARIEDYGGRGALAGWVRVVAVRLAVDLLRQRGKQPAAADDDVIQSLAISADSELQVLAERYRGEVKAAFQEAFTALSAVERNLLRLHYLDGLTIDEIAAMKRVHRSTAARRIVRCCEQVASRTHRLLVERLGIEASQVESVMRLLRSHLDLSLERWLGRGPAPRRS
jgi:RNA polymerase sigma-70 factor (ECF subfamily)